MCIYISIRFELSFAVAGMLALLHDVIIAIGSMSPWAVSFRCRSWLRC